MFTALLDTCVLWPDLQRDFLLSLAIEGMYRPVWSSVVLEELEYEQRTKLIERGNVPDPDDEHLVAAAVVANAGAIITLNVRDLPADKLPHGLQVLSPKEFAANTVSLDPVRACIAVAAIAKRSGRIGRVQTEEDILEILNRRYGMTSAVGMMRQAAAETLHLRPPQPRVSESEPQSNSQGLPTE
ncbi:hypothetical protein [Micromonospora ureilytica]|uniref:PIN domain-containing protein n=1 Tax=Micromonospora ureilytica TaxID=709868 RepID=A0ABS0JKJ1_9ACTN|nr:hypothetical protein [Micromonospora ureilytica]MBG6067577.1 hypothetical protein [Micromonospora ureilytica]